MFTKADIEKYFRAEKSQSLINLVIGILAFCTAIYFFVALKTTHFPGAAFPLSIFGLIFAIVGYTVYKRSDDDRIRNVYAYDMEPSHLKNVELPRMNKVMANFNYYRYVAIGVALFGIVTVLIYRNNITEKFRLSAGVGMVIVSVIILIADYFAAKRARIYLNGLQSFTSKL